jgi:hypothetical protein
MPTFRVAFNFSEPPNKGWTEVYYDTNTSINNINTFDPLFFNLAMQSRHQLCTLRRVRITQLGGNRISQIVPVNIQGQAPGLPANDAGPDVASTAAVCLLTSSAPISSRRVWMRGLPDDYVERDQFSGVDTPTARGLQSINQWINLLALNAYQIQSLTPLGAEPLVMHNITAVSGTIGAGVCTLTTDGVIAPPANSRIIVYRMSPKFFPGLNGHWSVLSATPTSIVIRYNLVYTPPTLAQPGKYRPETYQYGAIAGTPASGFSHFGSRDTGPGFSSGRGRRRAVRLRSL